MHASLITAFYAGLVAIGVTVAIERLGGRLGGLIGSIPTTIIPASLGFWWAAESVPLFRDSLYAVPAGMVINAIFLYSWRILPKRLPALSLGMRLSAMVTLSLLIWAFFAALLISAMESPPLPLVWVAVMLCGGQLLLGGWACRNNPPAPRGSRPVGAWTLLSRGILAALAIGVSVWMAEIGIVLLAGIASVFPAIFLTTMVSVWWSQGEAVQAGAVGPLMLGSASVSVYAIVAAVSIPALGLWWGPTLAWLLAVGTVSIPAWYWLSTKKQERSVT
ncbi:MAG: hypothetical protein CMP23_05840 [Rickettsiales bacterium]|nr:hypothetical protein [Rickettsiales bacterium]